MSKLATFVHVAGGVYGPNDKVPADVAKQITNPKAWVGGKAPKADADTDTGYGKLKVDDLKAEIDDRNDGRDEDLIVPDGATKADLVAALEADDAAADGPDES